MVYHPTNPNIPRLEEKIIQYCNENNITEYPRKKNGKPDFRKKEIKEILERIHRKNIEAEKEKILNKNKQENQMNYTSSTYDNYRQEIINMNDNQLKEF